MHPISAADPALDARALSELLSSLADALMQRGWLMATAESCTGGLIAGACTELPGSSRWFDRGFVTYSNAAKTEMLGVPAELIAQHGAVSEEVACAMAQGAAQRACVQAAVAVTGVAGPDGGSLDKPVGTVWMAWHIAGHTHAQRVVFAGTRAQVRQQTVAHVLRHLLQQLSSA